MTLLSDPLLCIGDPTHPVLRVQVWESSLVNICGWTLQCASVGAVHTINLDTTFHRIKTRHCRAKQLVEVVTNPELNSRR